MAEYTRYKTVRFEPKTWDRIESYASNGGVTTSEYIRSMVLWYLDSVADGDVNMNLIERLHEQMDRARDLRSGYDKIESGWFGSAAITATIRQAERSIKDGDAVEMLAACTALEALE